MVRARHPRGGPAQGASLLRLEMLFLAHIQARQPFILLLQVRIGPPGRPFVGRSRHTNPPSTRSTRFRRPRGSTGCSTRAACRGRSGTDSETRRAQCSGTGTATLVPTAAVRRRSQCTSRPSQAWGVRGVRTWTRRRRPTHTHTASASAPVDAPPPAAAATAVTTAVTTATSLRSRRPRRPRPERR